jgi:hypothetical protein
MAYSPLAIKRRNILGDLYNFCETVENIPVFLENETEEQVGFADESLGHYADAYLFHLPEDICKKLSTGHYNYAFDYELLENDESDAKQKRIKLNHIMLVGRKIRTK